jgi:cell division septal protein FtsQ
VSNEGRRRPAMSTYYRSGAQANDKPSPFEKRSIRSKRGKKLLIKVADLLAVALLIFLVIHSLIVSNDAKVIASDTSYHTQTNYQDSAKHYIKSLRNRNKVTFDTAAIVRSYQNDYPEVKATSVELPIFSQKPVIRLQISEPSFFLRSGDKEYLIDASGRPYFVKFYLGGDSAVQIGQFLAARHQFDQKNSQPTEYLDVRVGGKVFYK